VTTRPRVLKNLLQTAARKDEGENALWPDGEAPKTSPSIRKMSGKLDHSRKTADIRSAALQGKCSVGCYPSALLSRPAFACRGCGLSVMGKPAKRAADDPFRSCDTQ
jgi:hypothetical protein